MGTLDTLWRLDNNSSIWTPAYVEEENSFSPMFFAVGDSAVFMAYKGGYPGYYLYSSYATNFTQWIPLTSSTPDFYFHVYCLAVNGTGLFAGGVRGSIYLPVIPGHSVMEYHLIVLISFLQFQVQNSSQDSNMAEGSMAPVMVVQTGLKSARASTLILTKH